VVPVLRLVADAADAQPFDVRVLVLADEAAGATVETRRVRMRARLFVVL
jgi:hypothetical protein